AACIGGIPRVDGHGALPATLAIFAVGLSRDQTGTLTLPAALTGFGVAAPDCFLLVDPAVTVTSLTDAEGCAHQPVAVPLLPSLAGTSVYAQWFVLDPAANAFGLANSNAIALALH